MQRHASTASRDYHRLAVPPLPGDSLLTTRIMPSLAAFLSGAGLFLIALTLMPFPNPHDTETSAANDGNIINQIGYLGLGGIYLFAMLLVVDKRVLKRVVSPSWIVIFAIAFLSCLQSYDPTASARGLMLSLIAMILVAGVLVLPRSETDFVNAGANAILFLLLINYAALVIAPDRAIHSASGGEPWHAGFWKGHLIHKNVTAPVFSVLCMFGIYCLRAGATWRGALIALLAANFVLHTGSKTTIGFLPLAIMLVLGGRAIAKPGLMVLAHFIFTILIFCLTLGTIYSDTFLSITSMLLEDSTFTGRDDIWKFASASLPHHLWFGHGYASFWLSPVIRGMEANFEANWDVRGIVSGHNSYLDAVLTFGLPGGVIIILMLFVKPFYDYLRANRQAQSRHFADFCVMVIIFMTYNGMMESFFLNRADPMWLLTALAVFGLGLVARMAVRVPR
ncbi:MAG TPA: O-antigen ligase [Pararhizobium sp.]|uniref:O-antigen ligase family protein n=1 Tax=Pararhizobium sp. TaxID=1977563 RepID=UPI002BB389D8|nr:O-antigen ligase [Pararhizobium sp.]HTO33412.1 O-antigen ligase [Pararhizobium sp.]